VRDHLLSEQIDQEQRGVAFWAVAAQADGAAKKATVWTTPLADETLAAARALVHRLGHHRAATLQLHTQAL
jgi:hypothetical protein